MEHRSLLQRSSKDKPVQVGWNETEGGQALEEAVEGLSVKPKEGVSGKS